MSLIGKRFKLQDNLTHLQKHTYESLSYSTCNIHHLPQEYICIEPKCAEIHVLKCKQCQCEKHRIISSKKIVSKLSQFVQNQWKQISQKNKEIESQWSICLTNIDYCVDILTQLKKQILDRSQSPLQKFTQLVRQVYGMFIHDTNNSSPEMLVKSFAKLNQKYSLWNQNGKIDCLQCKQEVSHRSDQAKKASGKTKKFTEKALAFSQNLAQLIEQKLKYEKQMSKLKQISSHYKFTLRDLLHEKEQSKLEEIKDLVIQIPKDNQKEFELEGLIEKCKNLKNLQISNKNGKIEGSSWKKIVYGMQNLKFLSQLSLILKAKDLPFLTSLFKQRQKAVRQVQKLSLVITDEKLLNTEEVSNFVNTLQLKHLSLTLTRDNLTKDQMKVLFKTLRVHTSMSNMPLGQWHLNVKKNKLDGSEHQVSNIFFEKSKQIKTKNIEV